MGGQTRPVLVVGFKDFVTYLSCHVQNRVKSGGGMTLRKDEAFIGHPLGHDRQQQVDATQGAAYVSAARRVVET
jgi:hypothetical protein